uniref:Hydroxysteroid dehydrogenase-like protein 2 n=1 Tax=Eptatretus burgeri TaxID=7764 RepID=A0A8C4R1W2_EPTBU
MLPNTGKLAGRTLFVTGASRGIGKAIALKAAQDGASVVLAAKTAKPHPKLPGTIYSVAQEVEAAGGRALPCIVDVRDEQQVISAVESAVKSFGGIDILVNNASAISLTGTLETPMKVVDLMMHVNFRGTYLVSKICIPYLKKSQSPHILNLSPPINLNPLWFKSNCAYTISKYGMSFCVLGMAEEFRNTINVNALWPKTGIHTAAMDMLGGDGIAVQCRKTEIVADAAYAILSRPSGFSGNFLIDEDVLREEGISDFSSYAVSPGHPLLPDFFLDDVEGMQNLAVIGDTSGQGSTQTKETGDAGKQKVDDESSEPVAKTFKAIQSFVTEEAVQNTRGLYQFELTGSHPGTWFLDLKNGAGSTGCGSAPSSPDVHMFLSSEDFVKMFTGHLKPTMAFMTGKLKIKGDMGLALKLEKLMGNMRPKL